MRQAPPPPEKATKSTTGGRTDLYLHLQTHDKTAATASAGEPLLAAPGIGFDSVHVGLKLRGGKKLELKTCDKVASGADAGFLECWLKVRPESKIAVTNEILPFTAFDAGGNKAARAAAAERVANEVRITAMVAVQKVRYYKDNLQVDFLSGLELATINSRSEEEEEEEAEEAEDGVITSSSGDGGGADSDGLGSASVDSLSSDQLAHSGVPISKALEGERALRAIVTHQKAPLRNWVSLCVEGAKRVQLAEYVRQIGLLQCVLCLAGFAFPRIPAAPLFMAFVNHLSCCQLFFPGHFYNLRRMGAPLCAEGFQVLLLLL